MFINIRNDDGHVAPFVKMPCSAITPKRGISASASTASTVRAVEISIAPREEIT